MNPTASDLVVVYNAGGPRFGHAPLGWQDFWENRASQHEFVVLHNPGGHYMIPMQYTQLSRARSTYTNEPWTDYRSMAKHARKRTDWWAAYIGSPETFPPFPSESVPRWRSRAIDEIRDLIEARPSVIYFDAMQELDDYYRALCDRLIDTYGIQVGVEPCCYADQADMHGWPIAIQTEFIEKRAGTSGWNTGKNAARPLRNPSLHPYTLELVRGKNVPIEIEEARARGFVPAVNIGKLPKGIV